MGIEPRTTTMMRRSFYLSDTVSLQKVLFPFIEKVLLTNYRTLAFWQIFHFKFIFIRFQLNWNLLSQMQRFTFLDKMYEFT